jgi:F-type H+-transporting ATPase subunit epsilon
MVKISTGTFRFVLRTPQGTLIDCRTGSLLLPSHDGLQGIIRNHAPMLSKIGLGIIQVKEIQDREDAFFLVNNGFARINENFITVLSDDVTTFEGQGEEQSEEMLSEAKSHLAGGAYFTAQTGQKIDLQKAKLIVKMAEMAAIHS